MKLKRILSSVTAQFDNFVSSVENHEAVAESAIRAARQNTAKIRRQFALTSKHLGDLEDHHQALRNQAKAWQRRAIESREDKPKALRCIQSMKVIESELEQLNTQIKDTASLKSQLNQHLQAAEQQIITLQTRKENLSARTARNAVHHSVGSLTDQGDLDNVFERWEQNVVADEYLSTSTLTPVDEFENSFNEKEEREALEQTLETLLRENDEKGKAHE